MRQVQFRKITKGIEMKIHCIIISWQNYSEKAKSIASKIATHVDKLSVVYSNALEEPEDGTGNWVQVPNDFFYGKKFQISLDLITDDEIMLLIQADADCNDWKGLANRCRALMESNSSIGVWAPEIHDTSWTTKRVKIAENNLQNISFVTQTDGIVFSFNKKVLDRLRKLKYDSNNLGWGIDWIAICYSYIHNMYVIRDNAVTVNHVAGSGYSSQEAAEQMNEFFTQMNPKEMVMYRLLASFSDHTATALRSYQP